MLCRYECERRTDMLMDGVDVLGEGVREVQSLVSNVVAREVATRVCRFRVTLVPCGGLVATGRGFELLQRSAEGCGLAGVLYGQCRC